MAIVIKRKVAAPAPEPVIPERGKRSAPKHLDSMCLSVMETSPDAAIPWWLMASYLYYHHDISLLSDGLYDQMAKAMLEAWGQLAHDHKHLITLGDLKAGSLYRLSSKDYPNRTKAAAVGLVESNMGVSLKYIPS